MSELNRIRYINKEKCNTTIYKRIKKSKLFEGTNNSPVSINKINSIITMCTSSNLNINIFINYIY